MDFNSEIFFKMLSDNTRLRTLMLMQRAGELCVCELTTTLNLSQPKISRHLALLRDHDIVCARRDGQWMYYRINPELPEWMLCVLQETFSGIENLSQFSIDSELLHDITKQKVLTCCT